MLESQDIAHFAMRLGDTCLVLSQRLGEWCGIAHDLEEDVALSNVALDLLGQARLWLDYAGKSEGIGRDEDRLAFWRDGHDYYNLLLVEQPNGDFAQTQVRQFFFDAWYLSVLERLRQSSDHTIAAIAEKATKESAYHLRRSSHWVERLGDGTAHSHWLTQEAADALWDYVGEPFEPDALDMRLAAQGIGCDFAALHAPWLACLQDVFSSATLRIPEHQPFQRGGKQGRHSEHLNRLLADMQCLARAHPGATW